MRRRWLAAFLTLMAICAGGGAVRASGDGPIGPWSVDAFGGEPAEQARFFQGDVGVVMASAPRARLFMAWRLLHGQPVGAAAGAPLSVPCCDQPRASGPDWIDTRKAFVAPSAYSGWIRSDRDRPDGSSVQICFDDALQTAAITLKDRASRFGADSPWVKAWLATQDAVFKGCHYDKVALPPLDPAAPAWLKADYAYQSAALALYQENYPAALQDFAAIGRDPASPWRTMAPYLAARTLVRETRSAPSPALDAEALKAIEALEQSPAGTYGQAQAPTLRKLLALRTHPDELRAQLDASLNAPTLSASAAVDFRDYVQLNAADGALPPVLDWIVTLKAAGLPKGDPTPAFEGNQDPPAALAHAKQRWAETHDPAWLIAALSLANSDDPDAAALIRDADLIKPDAPAYLTVTYNAVRLSLATAKPRAARAKLDAILARTDLSISDRNLFTAERMQFAENLRVFGRLAVRKRLCAKWADDPKDGCARQAYTYDGEAGGIYDDSKTVAFGDDARALIDRMPLGQRVALTADKALPVKLRLDVDLTSWSRAVLLQDNARIDTLSRRLKILLPQLAPDWERVVRTSPGAGKRFAEFFIMAKIPGLRADLADYIRPEGTVANFQRYWSAWVLLGKTRAPPNMPKPATYYSFGENDGPGTDLVCYQFCGLGVFPIGGPPVLTAQRGAASLERTRYLPAQDHPRDTDAPPAGSVQVWEEVLKYAQAHPNDPRAPEALHWLVHVGRFGGGRDHLGKRAFVLLHKRYPNSDWARDTKSYYD